MSMQRVLLLGVLLALAGCVSEPVGSAAEVLPAAATTVVVEMKTSKGDILLELDAQKAPETVRNFVAYARDGFYDGTVFHRVIEGFMIQGGGYDAQMKHKDCEPIKGEFASNGFAANTLKHDRGVLSMARTNDPDSASSQFFVMHAKAPHLDGQYAGFGKVTEGLDVLDKIACCETGSYGWYMQDVPKDTIEIETIKVIEE